jgi:hypothetical protein
MKINNDHLYHGAALTQVAEHPTFKAINEISIAGVRSRCAFLINTNIGLYLKYATKPKGRFKEFKFSFHSDSLEELKALKTPEREIFVCLICVSARQICCVSVLLTPARQGEGRTGKVGAWKMTQVFAAAGRRQSGLNFSTNISKAV